MSISIFSIKHYVKMSSTVFVRYVMYDDDEIFQKWFPNIQTAWNWIHQRVQLHLEDEYDDYWSVQTLLETVEELNDKKYSIAAEKDDDRQYKYYIHCSPTIIYEDIQKKQEYMYNSDKCLSEREQFILTS